MPTPHIVGFCDERFAIVRDAFVNNFVEHGEIGASVCIEIDGRRVVDLSGGFSDIERTQQWHPDQLVNVFSVGKGVTSLLAAQSVDRTELSYDQKVSDVWPDFGCFGKETLTIRDVLGHKSALPALRQPLPDTAMYDWSLMTESLAKEAPWWKLDGSHGYHVNTFGFLIGEVLRRVTGRTVGQLVHERIASPLGADIFLGCSTTIHHRIAEFEWPYPPIQPTDISSLTPEQALQYNTYYNPPGMSGSGTVNTHQWRSAEIPSTNMHASARGVAAMYTQLAMAKHRATQLISSETLDVATSEVSHGIDRVLGRDSRFGHGFQIPIPERGFGPHAEAFGHYGAGGSVGFADPVTHVGFGYVMNQMGPRWQNPRNKALLSALYDCL